MAAKRYKIPQHLRPDTQRWVRGVMRGWTLEEHHVRLLVLAAEAFDQAADAHAYLAKQGETYSDKRGVRRVCPEVGIEHNAKVLFTKLIRELGLDDGPAPEAPRPPALRR